jgi:hypothetical protein
VKLQEAHIYLGNDLGFLAYDEYPFEDLYPGYSPIIDVVWFYPLSDNQSKVIKGIYDL